MAGMHDDARPSFQETQEQVNLTSVKLLLTDAALALTFISVAETTGIAETVKRNVHNAHKA